MHVQESAGGQPCPSWVSEHLHLFTAATQVKVWFSRPEEPKRLDVCHVYRSGDHECRANCRQWHDGQASAVPDWNRAVKVSCPMEVNFLWAQVSSNAALYGYLYTEPVSPADTPMGWRSSEICTDAREEAPEDGLRKTAIQRMPQATSPRRDGLLLLLELLAEQLGERFHQESRLPVTLDPSEALVRRAEEILCSRYHEDISTCDVASELHVSDSHLCHAFKRVTGGTLRQRLNDLRFSEACRLLKDHPHLTAAEVAFAAGFQSLSRFNEQFRRRKMPSPGKWRLECSLVPVGCSAG